MTCGTVEIPATVPHVFVEESSLMHSLSTRTNTATPHQSALLPRLPQPAFWGLWVTILSLAVLAIGVVASHSPQFTSEEFTVDQELSKSHVGVLTGLVMVLDRAFSPVGGVVMIGLVCLFLWLFRTSFVNALAFGGVASAGWLSSQLFKVIVARQRPNPALLIDPLSPETGSTSFPSGHVALAVGLAWAFYFLLRKTHWARPVMVLAVVVPLVVAWSRIYVGVHYPSDVIASFLAASAGVMLFVGVWNLFRGAGDATAATHPSV
ncbi:hypothetical protein CVS30_13480 [Arthrobacter psychrolactophilus]|uniref:Phosphatidic acid phosphatase type 2/haloperoxidase domain-containing protein n=2 Tax=Arthrobacter psychrolactophilus TaxID=92442 RepID=A0A2V5INZ9_9MICC|nr:hypothetical protein CVS30_13480 [Arthrobacter psychrolactophilus]